MGATQQLGKTLVFFPWKGLNVAREYVVPANPQTAGQVTQRGYVTAAVAMVHAAQALAANELGAADIIAYGLLANQQATPRTWFNEFVRQYVNQNVAGLKGAIFHGMAIAAGGAGKITLDLYYTKEGANDITAGKFYYGTSPSALIYSDDGVDATGHYTCTLSGLTTGQKYYVQFRPTVHADFVGCRSGIYHCVAG
jgi:hypothetical protein